MVVDETIIGARSGGGSDTVPTKIEGPEGSVEIGTYSDHSVVFRDSSGTRRASFDGLGNLSLAARSNIYNVPTLKADAVEQSANPVLDISSLEAGDLLHIATVTGGQGTTSTTGSTTWDSPYSNTASDSCGFDFDAHTLPTGSDGNYYFRATWVVDPPNNQVDAMDFRLASSDGDIVTGTTTSKYGGSYQPITTPWSDPMNPATDFTDYRFVPEYRSPNGVNVIHTARWSVDIATRVV